MEGSGTDVDAGNPPERAGLTGGLVFVALIGLAVLLGVTVALAKLSSQQRDAAAAWELHTLAVLDATSQLRLGALDAMRGERGFLITQDREFLAPYRDVQVRVAEALERVDALVADDSQQRTRLARVEGELARLTAAISGMMALEDAGRHEEVLERVARGDSRRALDRLLAELDAFERVERKLLAQRRGDRARALRIARVFETLLGLAGITLLSIGCWASLALRESRRREKAMLAILAARAATDELTGLANRRETMEAIDRQIAAARRHRRPLSLAVFDIDHFKRINDAHGHPAGDEVIRLVAQKAVEVMRHEDLVGRIGGEEFVVVLPETGAGDALNAAERLRRVIADTILRLDGGRCVGVTLSAGVAQMQPGDDRASLVARADRALYDAKAGGRDQVLLAA